VRSVFAIGKSAGRGVDIGHIPLPCSGEDPLEGSEPFYPMSVSADRYFQFCFRTRYLKLGRSALNLTCGDQTGSAIPQSFQRHVNLPADERSLAMFPGGCNDIRAAGSGEVRLTAGAVQLGWVGPTVIDPVGGGDLPDGSWPPEAGSEIDFQPFSIGRVHGNGLECAHVVGGEVTPFVFIWFTVAANNGGIASYFTPTNFVFNDGAEALWGYKRSEVSVKVFGWDTLPLYKVYALYAPEPIITTGLGGQIALHVPEERDSWYEYADDNDANPVYDNRTGRQLITPVPRDFSRAAIAV
jgi:hypothetical protein